ncbi:MAG: DUF4132 domain-containing protein, partial [Clostridiales bacterium]|nr:DUF4132 domain-containing protein [Clostridiales bacterium]
MDQMIKLIQQNTYNKKYTPEELNLIGEYLIGNSPLETLNGVVSGNMNNYIYGVTALLDDIIDGVKKQPDTILPRLRRFLCLLKTFSQYLFNNTVEYLLKLGPKTLFIDSGFGVQEMLSYYFAEGYGIDEKMPEILAMADRDYPGELERYIDAVPGICALVPMAWLCAKRGEDILPPPSKGIFSWFGTKLKTNGVLPERLAQVLLFTAVGAMKYRSKEAAFQQLVSQENAALYAKLTGPDVAPELNEQSAQRCRDYRYHITRAAHFSEFRLPGVHLILRLMCWTDYEDFIDALQWMEAQFSAERERANLIQNSWYASESKKDIQTASVVQQMRHLEAIFETIGLDKGYLCAWSMRRGNYQPEKWQDALSELYGNDERTLAFAAQLGCAFAMRALHKLGKPLSDAHYKACIAPFLAKATAVCDPDEAEAVCSYLLNGGALDSLPALDAYYIQNGYYHLAFPQSEGEFSIWAMAGIHPMTERYFAYLVKHHRVSYVSAYINYTLRHALKSPAAAAVYLLNQADHTALMRALADSSEVSDAGNSGSLSKIFSLCVKSDPEAAAKAMPLAEIDGKLVLLNTIYKEIPNYNINLLLGCLDDKSKKVRELAYAYLSPKKELIETVRPLLEARKKNVREAAERLMAVYEDETAAAGGDILATCARLMPKSGKAALKWAFPMDLPKLRKPEGGDADALISSAYLYLMLTAKTMEMPPKAASLRALLHEGDLHRAAVSVFQQWLAEEAPAKHKAAILLFAVHADDADVLTLHKQIETWADASRGAVASEAVRAMVLGGSDLALMTVDSIARKFKNKQVRRAAQEGFAAAATALGISEEMLGDRIIPSLGFDERGEKVIDYGTRSFTAILSPSLTIDLTDDSGKKIKALPKPGAKDDTEKAEAAKSEFAALKKSLKTVAATQTTRLEQALATGRR